MATVGNKGQVLLTSRPGLTLTSFALTDSGDHKTFFTPLAQSAKRYWDNEAVFTFESSPDGTTWSAATPANVQYIGGIITFASAIVGATPSARVASGAYLPWAALAQISEWDYELSRNIMEDTTMSTDGNPTRWRTYTPGLLGATSKLSRFQVNGGLSGELTSDSLLVLSGVLDLTTGIRMESFAKLQKQGLKIPLDGLETEDLDLQNVGPVYFLAS